MKLSRSLGQDMPAGRRVALKNQHRIVEIIKVYCRRCGLSPVCSVILVR